MALAVTFPGKMGDAILQFPVPFHHWRNTGERFTAIFDKSLRPLETLFRAQPCVEAVEYLDGVQTYVMGGQPWDFGKDKELRERFDKVYHMGFRTFPHCEISLFCMRYMPVAVSWDDLVHTQAFNIQNKDPKNRLVIHSTMIDHRGRTPKLWSVLQHSQDVIAEEFDEVVFVGSKAERDYACDVYPQWGQYDDNNDFLTLAQYVKDSRVVLGGGSCVVALAGGVHTPSIRIHDHVIGTEIVVCWTNVAPYTVNVEGAAEYNHLILREFLRYLREKDTVPV